MDFISRVVMKRAQDKKWLKKLEPFKSGDTVKVYVKIKEGEKERVQLYRGVCIKIQGTGLGKTFTVRKISSGVGVERTFPFSSPNLEKVEVVSRGKVRRSRLYFLRDLSGRAARLNAELVVNSGEASDVATPDKAEDAKA
jgi:large subunit ribosomal protein L19